MSDKETDKKLEVAWRYNNLLSLDANPSDVTGNGVKSMGKGFPLVYKFDNSKPMGETISNSLSNKLFKDKFMHLITFDNTFSEDGNSPLDKLWHDIVEQV